MNIFPPVSQFYAVFLCKIVAKYWTIELKMYKT